ncbi:unnamed protein product [Linum tenue]|uniref:Caffeoyl-CoA O-methyltransferase n=1 Tax=Linum tenue TaxID=586396 RepID=A0AAV0S6C8_9ROSI|nr:unnamed protein product [Linum tenue]
METTVYPREPQVLKELRDATAKDPRRSPMAADPHASQFMTMLLKMMNPKRTIEIGVYTGYSLLATAISTPPDAKITAIDPVRSWYEIGLPFIIKAGIEDKIDFIQSQALPILDNLLLVRKEANEGSYDFAYVDADKLNYWNYHERLMKLVKVGGIIAYDNTLWGGSVAADSATVGHKGGAVTQSTIQFNKSIAADPRVDISLAPLGDGITVCRRIY